MPPVDLTEMAQAICVAKGYAFVERVGEGSFKETFHVRASDGASLALKVLREGNSPQRLQREIDAMSRCRHPNIGVLSSIDVVSRWGSRYLYMTEEYLEGGRLTDKISRGQMTGTELMVLGEVLISAVAHIASQGLVHRDLKPDNIMFRKDGRTAVIVDFGIVRDLSQPTLTQAWLPMGPGTPFYAAPEQLSNQKELIDWRTDQFALGVLLAECALGYHPYSEPGYDATQIVQRVAQRQLPSARFVEESRQQRLPALVRMVAPWPVGRYRTPEELSAAWRAQAS